MSREHVGLEGYEPGNGYQPADFGFSLRDFLKIWPLLLVMVISSVLRANLGSRAALAFLAAVFGAQFLYGGIRWILNPERYEKGKTEKGARRLRIEGIVAVMLGTTVMTLALCYILFLWDGW